MKKASFLTSYSVLFILAFFIFPSWLAPPTSAGRWTLVSALLVVWLVTLAIISWKWPKQRKHVEPVHLHFSHKLIMMGLFILLLIMVYPAMDAPIRAKTDEGVHVHLGAALLEHSVFTLGDSVFIILRVLLWAALAVFAALFIWNPSAFKRRVSAFSESLVSRWQITLPAVTIAILLWSYLVLKLTTGFPYVNIRALVVPYESLGILFTSVNLILTGYNEFWVRLPFALFLFAGAVMTYKLVCLYSSRRSAIWSAVIYVLLPVMVFFFGHAKPITAETFFVVASLYYFLRYKRHGSESDLWISMLIAGAGTMYKLAVMLVFFVIAGYVFFSWLSAGGKQIKHHLKTYLPPMLVGLSFIASRNIIHDLFHYPPTWPTEGGYTIYHLTSYAKLLPLQITWTLSVLFVIGIIVLLLTRRDAYGGLLLAWLSIVYFSFASHKTIVSPRWTAIYLPAVAIVVAEMFDWFAKRKLIARRLAFLPWLLIIVVAVNLIAAAHSFIYIDGYQNQFLPQEEAAMWIAENAESGVYRMPLPYYFYERKAGVDVPVHVGAYAPLEEQNLKSLYEYAIDNDIGYVVFPVGETWGYPTNNVPIGPYSAWYYKEFYHLTPRSRWTSNDISQDLIDSLKQESEYFRIAAGFAHGNNLILIAEVKGSLHMP